MPQSKGSAAPLVRTPRQKQVLAAQEAQVAAEAEAAAIHDKAQRLAQIVNLHIAGYSLADIGATIGATEAEVDRMLTADTARYVKTQPALRIYVRNWISEHYTEMLKADWGPATDENHRDKLENQDRALRILDRMAKLHGAEAPTQSEIKVDAAPEAVDKLVAVLSASQGLGYETDIFDTVPSTVVQDAHTQSRRALTVSGNQIDDDDEGESADAEQL